MNVIIYLLQVSACTGIFFLFYKLVLSRFTFFTLNRWYLLGTLLISFLIPMITIPAGSPQPLPVFEKVVFYNNVEPAVAPTTISKAENSTEQPIDWASYPPLMYFVATIALALKLAASVLFFFLRIRGKQIVQLGNVKVIKGDIRFKNGSFLNYVFLDEQELSRAEVEQILAHELVHIKLLHSLDRLFARLVQVVLWFNPFSYFYQKAIIENHEFETDRAVTLGTDKGAYADLLLRLSISPNHALYNNFSMIPLKKRVGMLFTKPTKNMKKIFYVLVLPLLVLSCLAFANRDYIKEKMPATLKAAFSRKTENPKHDNSTQGTSKLSLTNLIETLSGTAQENAEQIWSADSPSITRVSGIPGVSRLGQHPLVKIDDNSEFVDPEILYKIHPGHIAYAIKYPNSRDSMFGKPIPDGGVHIVTANKSGNYTLMTDLERENVIKVSKALNSSSFTRVRLKKDDGSDYEMLILQSPTKFSGRSFTNMDIAAAVVFKNPAGAGFGITHWEARVGAKAAFYLNDPLGKKVLNETQLDELTRFLHAKANSFNGFYVAPRTGGAAGADLSAYDVVFQISFRVESGIVCEEQDTVDVKNLRIGNTLINALTESRIFTAKPRALMMNSSFTMVATEFFFDIKTNTVTGIRSGGPPTIFLKQRQDGIQADSIKINLTSGKVIIYNKAFIKKAPVTDPSLPTGSTAP